MFVRVLLLGLLSAASYAGEPEALVLWPGGAPGSEGKAGIAESQRLTERGEQIVSRVHAPNLGSGRGRQRQQDRP